MSVPRQLPLNFAPLVDAEFVRPQRPFALSYGSRDGQVNSTPRDVGESGDPDSDLNGIEDDLVEVYDHKSSARDQLMLIHGHGQRELVPMGKFDLVGPPQA